MHQKLLDDLRTRRGSQEASPCYKHVTELGRAQTRPPRGLLKAGPCGGEAYSCFRANRLRSLPPHGRGARPGPPRGDSAGGREAGAGSQRPRYARRRSTDRRHPGRAGAAAPPSPGAAVSPPRPLSLGPAMSLPAGAGLSACAEGSGRAPYPHGELRGRAEREPPGGGRRRARQRASAPGHGEGAGAASARLPPAAGLRPRRGLPRGAEHRPFLSALPGRRAAGPGRGRGARAERGGRARGGGEARWLCAARRGGYRWEEPFSAASPSRGCQLFWSVSEGFVPCLPASVAIIIIVIFYFSALRPHATPNCTKGSISWLGSARGPRSSLPVRGGRAVLTDFCVVV